MNCVCGHRPGFHDWYRPKGKPGYWRACSVYERGGKCPCVKYEAA